jgi:hypothetical protein
VLRAGDQRIAGYHDVAPAQLKGIEPELVGQLIECALDTENDLPEPVSTERSRRQVVGVDRPGVDPLIGNRYMPIDSWQPWNMTPGLWLP